MSTETAFTSSTLQWTKRGQEDRYYSKGPELDIFFRKQASFLVFAFSHPMIPNASNLQLTLLAASKNPSLGPNYRSVPFSRSIDKIHGISVSWPFWIEGTNMLCHLNHSIVICLFGLFQETTQSRRQRGMRKSLRMHVSVVAAIVTI